MRRKRKIVSVTTVTSTRVKLTDATLDDLSPHPSSSLPYYRINYHYNHQPISFDRSSITYTVEPRPYPCSLSIQKSAYRYSFRTYRW